MADQAMLQAVFSHFNNRMYRLGPDVFTGFCGLHCVMQIWAARMTITEVVARLNDLPGETFICAKRPWSRDAAAVLLPFPEDLRIPEEVKADGYEYFLEVSTANEILEGFIQRGPSLEQITDFVLFYAENDAFPDWSFDL